MLSTLLRQTSCTTQESYLLAPVTLGKIIFSWALANIMRWTQQLLELFRPFQTCITGEPKTETVSALTDLQDYFYQMDKSHDLGGMRRNGPLRRFR